MREREATVVESSADNPAHVTPEMAALIYKLSDAMIVVQDYGKRDIKTLTEEERVALKLARKLLRGERRKIRYRLFRIRDAVIQGNDPDPEYDSGLKAWMELQFQHGMTWAQHNREINACIGGFTFEWDIACDEPLKVIPQFAWDGQVERRSVPEVINGQSTGRNVIMDVCDPSAFTRQG